MTRYRNKHFSTRARSCKNFEARAELKSKPDFILAYMLANPNLFLKKFRSDYGFIEAFRSSGNNDEALLRTKQKNYPQ